MSQRAEVFHHQQFVGILEKTEQGHYQFTYNQEYLNSPESPPISATLPKQAEPFNSPHLFSFFYGLLAEGHAKEIQCRLFKLDERDHFGRLLKTAHTETIGSITVKEVS